ncbi:PH domain-containing protein [Micrococcus porci]|uniref:PH domain-containing protein n=1 Tax=Micrococcus porci TaxID=2856555 RepID=UPI003CF88994
MPGIDLQGVEFTPVSPALVRVEAVREVIALVIWLAVVSVPLVLKLTGVWPDMWSWTAWGLPALVLAWSLVELVLIPRRVAVKGWAEREDDVLWREGILFRRVVAVPYGRLQYVDVTDGPLLRWAGLQKLTLKTAGGADVELVGLPRETCDRLREVLMARGQARLAGL